jgi:phosphoribosylformimino-5-aminoimidazole carboxamide ribotide isomerase
MVIFPAIDIKDGRCVRLMRGDMASAVVYGEDPVAMARRWAAAGAEYLHVVDLDGAVAGRSVNTAVVRTICAAVEIPVQVGGGIRDATVARALLDAGAARVILGTAAYREPGLVALLCVERPGRIAVGIDARGGAVAGDGWTTDAGRMATDLAAEVARAGVACVIYTDIGRDGTETGPDLAGTRTMARALATHAVPLIASGGVGSLADVTRVRALAPDGVAGLIIGRALYTGAVDLGAAIEVGRGAAGDADRNGAADE